MPTTLDVSTTWHTNFSSSSETIICTSNSTTEGGKGLVRRVLGFQRLFCNKWLGERTRALSAILLMNWNVGSLQNMRGEVTDCVWTSRILPAEQHYRFQESASLWDPKRARAGASTKSMWQCARRSAKNWFPEYWSLVEYRDHVSDGPLKVWHMEDTASIHGAHYRSQLTQLPPSTLTGFSWGAMNAPYGKYRAHNIAGTKPPCSFRNPEVAKVQPSCAEILHDHRL